eukprot:5038602-Alexandrium_andersonii.AAC.1
MREQALAAQADREQMLGSWDEAGRGNAHDGRASGRHAEEAKSFIGLPAHQLPPDWSLEHAEHGNQEERELCVIDTPAFSPTSPWHAGAAHLHVGDRKGPGARVPNVNWA